MMAERWVHPASAVLKQRPQHPSAILCSVAPALSVATTAISLQRLGQFAFQVGFRVNPAQSGYVVQQVDRAAVVTARYGTKSHALSAAEIDAMSSTSPNYANWTRYWEVFDVDTSGASTSDDQFSFSQMDLQKYTAATYTDMNGNWTSDGTFTITGTARFYPGVMPATAFNKGATTNPANGLPWATNNPGLATAGASGTYTHAASVTWQGSAKQTLTYAWGTNLVTRKTTV